MKKFISVLVTAAMLFSFSTAAFASERNIGLSPNPPYAVTRGAYPPDIWEVWNVADKGTYEFSGFAEDYSDTDLYTNYHFTGKTSYQVRIINTCSSDVTVTFSGWYTNYRVVTVPADSVRNYTISTMYCDEEITESTIWYMRFSAPCEVEGYVK